MPQTSSWILPKNWKICWNCLTILRQKLVPNHSLLHYGIIIVQWYMVIALLQVIKAERTSDCQFHLSSTAFMALYECHYMQRYKLEQRGQCEEGAGTGTVAQWEEGWAEEGWVEGKAEGGWVEGRAEGGWVSGRRVVQWEGGGTLGGGEEVVMLWSCCFILPIDPHSPTIPLSHPPHADTFHIHTHQTMVVCHILAATNSISKWVWKSSNCWHTVDVHIW